MNLKSIMLSGRHQTGKSICFMKFHLYEIPETAKPICSNRKQISHFLGLGVGSKGSDCKK